MTLSQSFDCWGHSNMAQCFVRLWRSYDFHSSVVANFTLKSCEACDLDMWSSKWHLE